MVFNKLKEIVVDQLQLDPNTITRDSRIVEDLNADSLDVVEMLMRLEEEFDVSIPDEEAVNLKTVGNIVDFVEKASKK